jgi:hypothetical protein
LPGACNHVSASFIARFLTAIPHCNISDRHSESTEQAPNSANDPENGKKTPDSECLLFAAGMAGE